MDSDPPDDGQPPSGSSTTPPQWGGSGLLEEVLSTTSRSVEEGLGRLTPFLTERSPEKALRLFLGLGNPEAKVSRRELRRTLGHGIVLLDRILNAATNAILHHPRFQALEASWRGLDLLVERGTECETDLLYHEKEFHGQPIQIRVLDVSWKELMRDFQRAGDPEQSQLFRHVYEGEFGLPGGMPFAVMLGDYPIENRPDHLSTLGDIARVAAAAFCPFVASADPSLLGVDHFDELDRALRLRSGFSGAEFIAWNSLRKQEDSRFVGLTLPRTLLRAPHRDTYERIDGFPFREDLTPGNSKGYLFGNAVWSFGSILLRAFAECGWLAGIRGVELDVDGGGLVDDLPRVDFRTDTFGVAPRPSTDVLITDSMEKVLADLGFIPLCDCTNTPFSAFYSNQSIQLPKVYDDPVASVNARLSGMLQYMFCVSRFAHYIKVIGRDKVGSFQTADECERYLQDWLISYSIDSADADSETMAKSPLREGRVRVRELPGKPGNFACEVHLRPHFQLDQLTSSVRLLTELAPALRV